MKKIILALITISIFFAISIQSFAVGEKSLEVTLAGFPLLYQTCMDVLEHPTNIRREWISDNQAMVYLTDICMCIFTTEEGKGDFSNIIEVLHTSAPQSHKELIDARCSMVATIMTFDPSFTYDNVADFVVNVLPKKGEYVSTYCRYKYVEAYNTQMLYISPV